MTVMVPLFFGIPQHLVRSGLWAKLKPGERSLYVYLMYESERRRTREVMAKDSQIAPLAGVRSRTLCNARKKLSEHKLIRFTARHGNVYVYTICDSETGLPYPGDPKEQAKYVKKETKREDRRQSAAVIPVRIVPAGRLFQEPMQEDAPLESYGLPGVFDNERAASFAAPRK